MPTQLEHIQAGINTAMAFGTTALAGVMALCKELRPIIGDEGVDRVREAMLARVNGMLLPDELRFPIEREVLQGTTPNP